MAQYIDIHSHGLGRFDDDFIVVGDIPSSLPYCLGRHPWQAAEGFDFPDGELSGALAIGEVGLDYSGAVVERSPKEVQLSIFRRQVEIAEMLDKPLVLHSVQAQGDTLEILRSVRVAWVWHGFGRKAENGRQILAVSQNGFLSFGAKLLHDKALQQVFAALPVDRIFLETDAQQQIDIADIYCLAAQLKNITVDQLKENILENFNKWLGKKELTCFLEQKN